jgi:hypothetical protein
VRFKQELKENLKIEIVDIIGKTHLSQTFQPQIDYSLNLSYLHTGYYIANLYIGHTLIGSTKIAKR